MTTTIQVISNTIETLLQKARAPLTVIPSIILVCSAIQRPGLSAKSIAASIIKRQGEAGAPIGAAADGSQNISEAMEVMLVGKVMLFSLPQSEKALASIVVVL